MTLTLFTIVDFPFTGNSHGYRLKSLDGGTKGVLLEHDASAALNTAALSVENVLEWR